MTITSDDLCRLTRAIWESTLDLVVLPIPEPSRPERRASMVTGSIQIVGTWLGTVLLECSEKLAKQVARAMFGLDGEEPTAEEVRDALAEITNVTAGNLKSLLSGQCQMSTPEVKECGLDGPLRPDKIVITRQAFSCQGELLFVTLLEG